ncbi:MAG: hypothetical protein K5761_05095 [Clostridiales bacterium]|nr:hypothetical protein [Clostridiales bacterium]
MKKILSLILAVICIFSISIPVFAATVDERHTSGNMIADYKAGYTTDDKGTEDPTDDDVESSYDISIPEYIVVTAQNEDRTVQTVEITNAMLEYDTILYLSLSYSSLKCGRQTLGYKFQRADDGSQNFVDVQSGSNIIEVRAGSPNAVSHMNLSAVLTQSPIFAGNYTDTVTFNATVR